jgi:hypothetical protein
MRLATLALRLCLSVAPLHAQTPSHPQPDATTIMALVAANQDRSAAERAHYIYLQHARVISRKGNTVRCEEVTDARITPTATNSTQQLLKLDGRLLVKHHYVTYTHLPDRKDTGNTSVAKDDDSLTINIEDNNTMDRDLVEDMRDSLIASDTKDGIAADLFPLTSTTQTNYAFHLVGLEPLNGRQVFHLTFQPKNNSDATWKGDAYIDATAFEPVVVRTTMAHNIPFAVRTLLGTSLPGLGFTVVYAPQPGGVWFPVSFGTEFRLHVLFFFNREIIVNADNRDFEQTHVFSTIHEGAPTDVTLPKP